MNDDADIPMRDSQELKKPATDEALARRIAQQRQLVNKWTRNELEDKYLVLLEENLTLKRHARKQEEKIKRMATKQLRLMSELKMKEQNKSKPTIRDTELEDQLEELKRTVQQQEQQNQQLRDRLLVAKQQLTSQGARKTPYNQVQARIDTNMARTQTETRNMKTSGPVPMKTSARYGQSMHEDSRQENRQLHDDNQALRQRIAQCEHEIMSLREQLGIRETEHTEELIRMKQQLNADQRGVVDENIKMIRLTNELRDKSNKLSQLQAQYSSLEENTRQVKRTHDQVLTEMDNLHQQLKHEQNRCLMLQNELKAGSSSQRTILELQERAKDLERECELLRDANEQLVSKAFDLDRERDWRKKENALKVHIAQLEATLKADVGEKGSILDRLNTENDRFDKLTEEHKDLRVKYYQLKHEHDQLQDKLSFFSKESTVDMRELEEALVIVKKKKEKGDQELDFLHKVEEEKHMDRDKENTMLKAQLADTVNELEKTRNLLIVQYKINNECRKEVEMSQRRMEEDKTENDTRLNEMAQMLDIRAARIKKLEAQLRDVAYGTKSVRIRPEEEQQVDDDEQDETIALERGQNLFEIHIKKVSLSQEGLRQLGDEEPLIFCTWDFYEYETQSTAVLKGPRADFGFTSQYVVTVDDFFLHYLQKDSCTLELHQSLVTDFKTLAACQLKMRDILDKPAGRIHATGQLIGVENGVPGVSYGIVEYWVRLKVPMEQALRLYKERVKALGYVESNMRTDSQPQLTALDDTAARRAPDNINELTIDIIGCKGVNARQRDVQPNVYCVYKFFDFNDYVTSTVESSNSPQFNDHKKYPVAMDADLDKYLKTQALEVYVFDDTDANLTNYLGATRITLLPLSRDKDISGNFELFRKDGSANGVIEIHIKWAYSYLPTHTALVATDKSKKKGDLTSSQSSVKRSKDTVSPIEPERIQKQSKSPSPPKLEEKKKPEPSVAAVDKAQPPVKSGEPTKSHSSVKDREDGRNGRPVEENKPQPRPIDPLPPAKVEPKVQAKEKSPPASRDKPPMSSINDSVDITEGTPVSGESDALTDDDDEDVVTPRDDEMDVTEEMQKQLSMAASQDEPTEEPGPSSSSSSVVMGSLSARDLRNSVAEDRITVTIFSLTLSDSATHILNNDEIQKLFIEYSFLDVPSNELETPITLPKLPANKPLSFNFNKVIPVDYEKNQLRRQHLARWLLPENTNNATITFTVVSEPVDDTSDCEDIGFAYVNLVKDILHKKRDMEEQKISVFDATDESKVIGHLSVTVKCLQALNNIKEEMIDVD